MPPDRISTRKQIILGGIIFLVSSLSFGLGYLANREGHRAPIIIEKCSGWASDAGG